MTRENGDIDLDALVRVDKIPPAGRVVTIGTDADQKEALAERLKVGAVTEFLADLLAVRFRGGIRVTGQVSGTVVQPCVVSGVPVSQTITERIDRIYLPGHDAAGQASAGAEIFVNLDDDDLPDYFEGETIDLTDLVLEVFALSIDLYPRAPGAQLPEDGIDDDPGGLSPFAALKALRKD